jgi:hypothetical protein
MIGAGTAAAPRRLPTKPTKTIHFQTLNECMCERTSERRSKEKYKDVAICSPPSVLWLLHSGCAVPSLLAAHSRGDQLFKPISTLVLHLAPDSSHASRRRKSTQRGEKRLIDIHSPPAFLPQTAFLLVDQGLPLNPPNHGRCETWSRFPVCPSPATARMAF